MRFVRLFRHTAFLIASIVALCGDGSSQTAASIFKASSGQTFYLDLDSAAGSSSAWRHEDLGPLTALQAVLRVPEIRKHRDWLPVFTISLQSKDYQTVANNVGIQIFAEDGRLPLKVRLVGHVNGRQIQPVPLQPTLKLNDELKMNVSWATPDVVTFQIGDMEAQGVRTFWPVGRVVISASTGELIADPLVFGTVAQ